MAEQEKSTAKGTDADKTGIKAGAVRSGSTAIAIVVAVLIAGALIALGYAIYNTEEQKPTVVEQSEEQDEQQNDSDEEPDVSSAVDEAAIDEAITNIDNELNSLDEDDFKESDLSDGELGIQGE